MANTVTTKVQYGRASFVLWLEVSFHSSHCRQAHCHVKFHAREVSNVCVVENLRKIGCAKQLFTVSGNVRE